MSSRPAPKRRAGKTRRPPAASARPSHSANRHRSSVATNSKPRRFPALPSPAVFGATALLVAGAGAAIVSSSTAVEQTTSSPSSYATLATTLSSNDLLDAQRGDAIPVSRNGDRDVLEQQAELQAKQRTQALAELAQVSQKRAETLAANQWVLPTTGYHLTATFGEISGLWSSFHTGLDFAAASGTPIVSVARGVVTSVGYDSAYGNKTVVTLDDGTEIWYCHQTSYIVSPGQTVNPGELIGYIGSTGNVTGPHLHLEVRPGGGDPVDPYSALVSHGVTP